MQRLMLLITSNAYEDREQEIVREKALESYVETCWKEGAYVGTNMLDIWHSVDSIGIIIFADMEGPFLIEVAQELPDGEVNIASPGEAPYTSTVKAIWDGLQDEPDLGCSQEFGYFPFDRGDSVYEVIFKTRSTVLPCSRAANGYTFAAVLGGKENEQ